MTVLVTEPFLHAQQPLNGLNCPQEPDRRTYLALDGLRGFAALLVVLFHIRWQHHLAAARPIRNGYLAVDLFLFFLVSSLPRIIQGE
jgi:uncharacterized membrane protein